jgi:hypothetical protein
MGGRKWTRMEIEAVGLRYGKEPAAFIAVDINRSAWAVRQQARRLKLTESGAFAAKASRESQKRFAHFSDLSYRMNRSQMTGEEKAKLDELRNDAAVIGYFAGLLDGEGTIHSLPVARCHITLANTSREMIEWLVEHLGGAVYPCRQRQIHHKEAWVWGIRRTPYVVAVLRIILPYLTTKKEKAEKAIHDFAERWTRAC